MKHGLTEEQAKQHIRENGLILDGFTVSSEHSAVLCERGYEWYYSKKRPDQRKALLGERQDKRGAA